MIGYIYLTECLINFKCYIGKRSKPYFDEDYIGSGTALKNAIKKYGKENFICQPIQWCETREELNEAERYWIAKCNAVKSDCFYNLKDGGEGNGLSGYHHSEETKAKLSYTSSQYVPTEEARKKISKANKGRTITPEWRDAISKGNKKRYEDPAQREKTSLADKKRYENPEERLKTSIAITEWWKRRKGGII